MELPMKNEVFEELLRQAKINKKEFANLVEMNYTSVTNWASNDNVPRWVRSWLKNYIKAKDIDKIAEAVKPYFKCEVYELCD